MSTIYDLTTSQQVPELLPPDKRNPVMVSWLVELLKSTVQFLRDTFMGDYRTGSTASAYSAGTYARGAKVIYNNAEYVSLIDGNTDAPTVTTSWYLCFPIFIGTTERQLYSGQVLVLTYALNRWFKTTFRQPGTGTSDIYLTNNAKGIAVFVSGGNESISSVTYGGSSSQFSINSYAFGSFINLVINVPTSVQTALGAANATNIILAFANKYIYAGIITSVTYY